MKFDNGEYWITMRDAKKMYKLTQKEIDELIAKEKVKFKLFRNDHNGLIYKAPSMKDLDKQVKLKVNYKEGK